MISANELSLAYRSRGILRHYPIGIFPQHGHPATGRHISVRHLFHLFLLTDALHGELPMAIFIVLVLGGQVLSIGKYSYRKLFLSFGKTSKMDFVLCGFCPLRKNDSSMSYRKGVPYDI